MVKTLVWLMRLMTPQRASAFTSALLRFLKPVIPFSAKIRANLKIAFPDKGAAEIERLTRNVCGNLGNAAVDLVMADRIWNERSSRVEFISEEGVDLAEYRSKAAVMVTGHIGAWQIASLIASQFNLTMTSIYAPERNPYLEDFSLRLRLGLPFNFVSRDGCMRHLAKELKNGHSIGLASDTRLDNGDLITFFGLPAPTNTTAARLALRFKCDFLPVRAERLPGMRFRITLCAPIPPRDPSSTVPEQACQMTQELSALFETWIRDTPDQWMCYGRRWPREAYSNS